MNPKPACPARRPGRFRTVLGWTGAATLLAIPLLGLHGTGAIDVYLSFEGSKIEGEADSANHKGDIEILSFSNWSASNSGTFQDGSKGGSGVSSFSDIGFTKWVDKSSPVLMLYCANRDHFPKAKLEFIEGGEKERPVLTIDFENVLVTSYQMGGSGGEDRLTDSFSLNFERFTSTVQSYAMDGSEGDASTVTWNVPDNAGSGGSSGGGTINTAPTISSISSPSISEDGSATVNFTVGDAQSAAGALTLSVGSANPQLLPPSRVTEGGSGANRSLTLSPLQDQSGSAQITVTVSDGSLSSSRTFVVSVSPENDPPILAPISAKTTEVDTPVDISVTLSDIDSPIDSLTLNGTATPVGIIESIVDTTTTGGSRTVRVTPASGVAGTATITLTAGDGKLVANQSFSLTVNPPEDANIEAVTLNGGTPVSLEENPLPGAVVGVLDAVDSSSSDHTFTITSATGPFRIGGKNNDRLLVDDPGDFDFETNPTLSVTVLATDQGDSQRFRATTFSILLSNVNEAAALALPIGGFAQAGPESTTPLTGISIIDPDSGSDPIILTISAADCVLSLDASGLLAGKITDNGTTAVTVTAPLDHINATLEAGGLTLQSDPDFSGSITVSFATNDQGFTGSGGAQSANATADIEIVLSRWQEWLREHFDSIERSNALVSGLSADPDMDGLPNVGEYSFGTDPNDGSSGPAEMKTSIYEDESGSYPELRFPRRVDDPTLVVKVELATDLMNWSSEPGTTTEGNSGPPVDQIEEANIRSLVPMATDERQQLRLRFSFASPDD